MLNNEIYSKDPTHKLVNEGVASVVDVKSEVLRYELETFVCDGQYSQGMERILRSYLGNLGQAQQQGVWVSGFFGAGKSHFIKMLAALWENRQLDDGSTARGLVHNLPVEIHDLLSELSTQGTRHGGLHVVAGMIGSGEKDVRLALLNLLFKSFGLPSQYHTAKFVLWLEKDGILNQVQTFFEENGFDWEHELEHLHVSDKFAKILKKIRPDVFSEEQYSDIIERQFPIATTVNRDDFLKTMKEVLSRNGQIPLTLIALDEVQQYIGDSSDRSLAIQELVEDCCKEFNAQILFVATGQTAITATNNLKKIEGRFRIRVELSDVDVSKVVRQVILAKKPEVQDQIRTLYQRNKGEISKHLRGTSIQPQNDEDENFIQDYPILPVRYRFWELALRTLDLTGTDSQLRNQLSMIHKAIQSNLDKELGWVVPAEFLFFDSAPKMLQESLLERKFYDPIMKDWESKDPQKRLLARACSLVFLINKITDKNTKTGIRADLTTLADLLVEDLRAGSASIYPSLKGLLDESPLLMHIDDEYRIQTEESASWMNEYNNQCAVLNNNPQEVDVRREEWFVKLFKEKAGNTSMVQGQSKVARSLVFSFDSALPKDADHKVCVWVQSGWNISENNMRGNACQAKSTSPTIFVFVPKLSADALRREIIKWIASDRTMQIKGTTNTAAGQEAFNSMKTIKQMAENNICQYFTEAIHEALVLQGGGTLVEENSLAEKIHKAAQASFQRLYTRFDLADNPEWPKVFEQARKGANDALKKVGHNGKISEQPVCAEILKFLSQQAGAEIRTHFESEPYGWGRDAVDGALVMLLLAGDISARENGNAVSVKDINQKNIAKILFKRESFTVSQNQKLKIRSAMQSVLEGVKEEDIKTRQEEFFEKLKALAQSAGGDAPKPETEKILWLDEIRSKDGNERLLKIFEEREIISEAVKRWKKNQEEIQKRFPSWQLLQNLLNKATGLDVEEIRHQTAAILQKRLLLVNPDPVPLLLHDLAQKLRKELTALRERFQKKINELEEELDLCADWEKLEQTQKYALRGKYQLFPVDLSDPLGTPQEVCIALEKMSLQQLRDRLDALPKRYEDLHAEAARLAAPAVQEIHHTKRTLTTQQEVEEWLEEMRNLLLEKLANGPVRI